MHVVAIGRAHPPHYYPQDELLQAMKQIWSRERASLARLEQFYRAVQVRGRHLALPIEEYGRLNGLGDANDAFIRVGTDVADAAVRDALDRAGLKPRDVDIIISASVTGLATPSIDARLVNRLKFRPDIKRIPIFGLGCVAGAAGIARMNDYLRAWPDQVALLVCVELCTLTLQRSDLTAANLVSNGLFGDGGAAVVAVGAKHPLAQNARGPAVMATRSHFYGNTERVMGWEIGASGFRVVLSAAVPDMVRTHLVDDIASFLHSQGLGRADIRSWVCHPGGPKVLEAYEQALGLTAEDLRFSWGSLREVGNMSSASVLFILADTVEQGRPPAGTHGMLLAMGPGFCSELVLLQW